MTATQLKSDIESLMRKLFLTFIVLTFAHIVFAQTKQTIVVRPETAREKEERKMNDVVETFQMLGGLQKEANAYNLNRVKNSKYSLYIEERLENWKKKGEFEKTADWQKRLNDSTAIKKAEIYESAVYDYARDLNVLERYHNLNNLFYEKYNGQYDADKEVLVVNTFWGKIPIPIPLDEAKNMNNIESVYDLNAHFFIQNDRLALLSLTFPCKGKNYTWENPSQAAQIFRNKRLELEQLERNKRLELERKQERLDSLELATYNQRLDSIFKDYNRQLLQNPYNLTKSVLTDYSKITLNKSIETKFNNRVSSMKSEFENLNNDFSRKYENAYRKYGNLFANKDEFDSFYRRDAISEEEIITRKFKRFANLITNMNLRNTFEDYTRSRVLITPSPPYKDLLTEAIENPNDPYFSLGTVQIIKDYKQANTSYYDKLIDVLVDTNKELNGLWKTDGMFFKNKVDFFEAYITKDYSKIVKANKKTLKSK